MLESPKRQTRLAGRANVRKSHFGSVNSTPQSSGRPEGHSDPVELFKACHGGRFTRSGNGHRANCLVCDDTKGALVVSESDGWLRTHCFKCAATRIEILASVGLKLSDVGPPRAWPSSLDEARRARKAIRESGWSAALSVLAIEGTIVRLAGLQMERGQSLDRADSERLALAIDRVDTAALVLLERDAWRPDSTLTPERLVARKLSAILSLQRQLAEAMDALEEARHAIK